MTRSVSPKRSVKPSRPGYILDEQIGFILRQVWQRHATIFAKEIGINLTPTQWAALAKLTETGPCSQNQLGRLTAMDVATIKGVIDRLTARHPMRWRSPARRWRRSMRRNARRW
jgi:MarR family transcriptional regulator, lower aerobic nicotinate degradation pathway regulator